MYCEISPISLMLRKKYTLKDKQCPTEYPAACYIIII